MAFDPREIQSTFGAGVDAVSILVYGESGVGKTSLAATTGALDKTLVLSCDGGLLALRKHKIKKIEITGAAKLYEVLVWLETLGAQGKLAGRWIVLDSITEIGERMLHDLLTTPSKSGGAPDGRAAYGDVQQTAADITRRFRDLPCNTVFLAEQDRIEDGERRLIYGPAMPGKKLAAKMPYRFDLVCALRVEKQGDSVVHWLQTEADGKYTAKDRSGALPPAISYKLGDPILAYIADTIMASVPPPEDQEPATPPAETAPPTPATTTPAPADEPVAA